MRSRFSTTLLAGLALGCLEFAPSCAQRAGSDAGASSAPSTATSTQGAPSQINSGRDLYLRYCALCHGKDGTGYAADNAPSLVSKTFLESADDAFIASGIRLGRSRTAMGAYGKSRGGPLDDHQIDSIVAWIRSHGSGPRPLPGGPPTGDATRGKAIYDAQCASCHGSEAERKTALSLYNPELLSTASDAFLRYAIVHGRPPTPMPAFAEKLSTGEIEDVVAWIRSKAPPPSAVASAPVKIEDGPVVINPKGAMPSFTVRDDRYVPADEVKKALDQKRKLIIVDARSPADYALEHIPGSISAPYYDEKALARIPNDGTWVIAYCACPHHASGEVVDKLRARGFKRAAILDEGVLVWKQRGYPLTTPKAQK
jgi:mono/diheme cytochrome c family protein/rhodanese-related sulfurtransferase